MGGAVIPRRVLMAKWLLGVRATRSRMPFKFPV